MKKGGTGGANTNASGLPYEARVASEIRSTLISNGFIHMGTSGKSGKRETFENNLSSLQMMFHNAFYTDFVEELGINFKDKFSARLIPDIALVDRKSKVLKIIEIKNQTGSGSVVEKLQTCDYKQYYYSKLLEQELYEVQVIWRLGSYFEENKRGLSSVYEYMLLKNSPYFFKDIPADVLLK
jgi:hypothetical protein